MNPEAEKMEAEILDIVLKCDLLPCEVSGVLLRVKNAYYADYFSQEKLKKTEQ